MGHVHGTMPISLLAVARLASKQGDLATASKLLREALPLAEEMRDVATVQQIVELLEKTSRVEPTRDATLKPKDGVWHIMFNGTSVHVPDFKGFWHLRELVSRPREPVLALALLGATSEDPLPIGDAGPELDREALRQYRKRLAQLDEQLGEAEAQHDAARYAKRTAEREALVAELARATGLGGRPRRAGSPTEKARLNVTRTIRHAITYLSTSVPGFLASPITPLERHFARARARRLARRALARPPTQTRPVPSGHGSPWRHSFRLQRRLRPPYVQSFPFSNS